MNISVVPHRPPDPLAFFLLCGTTASSSSSLRPRRVYMHYTLTHHCTYLQRVRFQLPHCLPFFTACSNIKLQFYQRLPLLTHLVRFTSSLIAGLSLQATSQRLLGVFTSLQIIFIIIIIYSLQHLSFGPSAPVTPPNFHSTIFCT